MTHSILQYTEIHGGYKNINLKIINSKRCELRSVQLNKSRIYSVNSLELFSNILLIILLQIVPPEMMTLPCILKIVTLYTFQKHLKTHC